MLSCCIMNCVVNSLESGRRTKKSTEAVHFYPSIFAFIHPSIQSIHPSPQSNQLFSDTNKKSPKNTFTFLFTAGFVV